MESCPNHDAMQKLEQKLEEIINSTQDSTGSTHYMQEEGEVSLSEAFARASFDAALGRLAWHQNAHLTRQNVIYFLRELKLPSDWKARAHLAKKLGVRLGHAGDFLQDLGLRKALVEEFASSGASSLLKIVDCYICGDTTHSADRCSAKEVNGKIYPQHKAPVSF